jgi:hypothetical protein
MIVYCPECYKEMHESKPWEKTKIKTYYCFCGYVRHVDTTKRMIRRQDDL